MAHTAVTLALEGESLVPDSRSVPFVEGDSISFATNSGGSAFLFFSPAAIAALAPPPPVPYALSGATAEFTFKSSEPGLYSVFFATSAAAMPPPFPATPSNELLLLDPSTIPSLSKS